MTTQEIKKLLSENDNHYSINNNDHELEIMFSEHLSRFCVRFNGQFMSTAKTIDSPLKKFNELKAKYSLTIEA